MSTELFNEILAGNIDKVRTLLQGGADCNALNDEGATALMLAAGAGNLKMVVLLIESGANVNAADALGWTALMKSVFNHELNRGFPEIANALIAAGADIETRIGYAVRPLMLAAGYGEAGVVEVLLAAGADVRAENEGGRTARMMAEAKDYVEVVNQLYQAEVSSGNSLKGACATGASSGATTAKVVNFIRNPNR